MNYLEFIKLTQTKIKQITVHIGDKVGMSALLQSIGQFSEEHKSWSQYAEHSQHFPTANQIQQAERKRAVLLSVIGLKAYKQLASLTVPSKPGEKLFQELLESIKEHHDPTPSTIVQCFKFHMRV